MDIQKSAKVISELETDTAADVLHAINKEKRALIIELLKPEIRDDIRLIASFDDDEIGSRMTTNFICIRENLSIKEAMKELIRQAKENDNISTIFVVEESGEFYGAVDLKDLITADSSDSLESLITTSFPYVYANEPIDDCIEKLKDYGEDFVPVLDNGNLLLGVITAQSVIRVILGILVALGGLVGDCFAVRFLLVRLVFRAGGIGKSLSAFFGRSRFFSGNVVSDGFRVFCAFGQNVLLRLFHYFICHQ